MTQERFVMNQSKDFFLAPETPHDLCTPVLRPMRNIATARAGAALRSHVGLALGSSPIADIHEGRLRITYGLAGVNSNLHAGNPDPPAYQTLTCGARHGIRGITLMIFTDRSAVLMRPCARSEEKMEILPLALQISNEIRIHDSPLRLKLTIEKAGSRARITASTPQDAQDTMGAQDKTYPLVSPDRSRSRKRLCLDRVETALHDEMESWAAMMDMMPALITDPTAPRCGVYDTDIAAPCPALRGQTFARPAVLTRRDVEKDTVDAAARDFHIAFTAIHDRFAALCDDFMIIIQSPIPPQGAGKIPPLDIACRALASREAVRQGWASTSIEAAIAKSCRELLKHPSIPDAHNRMVATTIMSPPSNSNRSFLKGFSFYVGRKNDCISSHDRLATRMRYGRDPV